ncbi:hypothetical protein HK101_011920, partial [Irineochytrium annulatum]
MEPVIPSSQPRTPQTQTSPILLSVAANRLMASPTTSATALCMDKQVLQDLHKLIRDRLDFELKQQLRAIDEMGHGDANGNALDFEPQPALPPPRSRQESIAPQQCMWNTSIPIPGAFTTPQAVAPFTPPVSVLDNPFDLLTFEQELLTTKPRQPVLSHGHDLSATSPPPSPMACIINHSARAASSYISPAPPSPISRRNSSFMTPPSPEQPSLQHPSQLDSDAFLALLEETLPAQAPQNFVPSSVVNPTASLWWMQPGETTSSPPADLPHPLPACPTKEVKAEPTSTANANPPRSFSCRLCGRSFARKHDCLRHERVHESHRARGVNEAGVGVGGRGGGAHRCEGCGRRYARADGLRRHRNGSRCGR